MSTIVRPSRSRAEAPAEDLNIEVETPAPPADSWRRRLQWAALALGVIAAVWHTPAFLMSGTKQSAWAFGPFFLGVVAISVILTAMFNAARGSLLVAVIFHAQMNGPAWPDAQPWDMYAFAVVAVLVVLLNRRTMLARGSGATDVLLDEGEDAPSAVGAHRLVA